MWVYDHEQTLDNFLFPIIFPLVTRNGNFVLLHKLKQSHLAPWRLLASIRFESWGNTMCKDFICIFQRESDVYGLLNTCMSRYRRELILTDFQGNRFRKRLLKLLYNSADSEHAALLNRTAIIVQVSSPGGAFSKLLDVMVDHHNGHIDQCLFVTQTFDMAVYRNRFKQPDSNTTGNRIEFDTAKRMIETYCDVFFKVPIGIIGVGFNFDA